MIIRDEPGGMLLIPQTEHSQFVGQLAAHWGNERFAVPAPFESVARAATYHDYGYLDWEPDVPFDASTGRPYEFRKLPAGERRLLAYRHCIDWISSIDAYSGLLVSMHRTGLWKNRYGAIDHPAMSGARRHGEDVDIFIDRAEAEQKASSQRFDARVLRINFHLLQVWDLLGLFFGCQEPGEDRIEPVPTGYADEPSVSLSMKNLGGGRVAFEPFPFDRHGLTVQMRGKRLAEPSYEDEKSFRSAWYRAPNVLLEYELV
ncbi:MAG: DUF3891 family protein [Burkholderiales bacterium]